MNMLPSFQIPTQADTPYGHFAFCFPQFYNLVKDFPDFRLSETLTAEELAHVQSRFDFPFPADLGEFFRITSRLTMNGLSLGADELGVIAMPNSDALITGYFFLHNPGDRLLMLPNDNAVYYLEQRNGAVTRLAANFNDFFNTVLPRHLYG